MQANFKVLIKFISLTIVSLLMLFNVSCESDKTDSKQSTKTKVNKRETSSQPLVASASLQFTKNNKRVDFECYKEEIYGEISIQNENVMYLRFRTVNKDGTKPDGPIIQITLKNPNGFDEGQTYSFSDDPAEKGLIVSINSSWKDPELYMADNDGIKQGSGELKITSLRENQIEGVFNFEVKHIIKKENKVIVSNGKFKDKIVQ